MGCKTFGITIGEKTTRKLLNVKIKHFAGFFAGNFLQQLYKTKGEKKA